ncbi:MAG: DinB family protein [Acidobacteria bacterium]|nr:DinB family protein [Acidobacteriota bacterium]
MSTTATQPVFTQEIAAAYREITLGRLEKENATTRRVIGNIPESKRDYKPEANSRSAWDLACHLAQSDVWFLNAIADGNFEWTGDPPRPANTVAGLVDWYKAEFAKAAARVRAMSTQDLLKPLPFFGMMNMPAFLYLQFAQDHAVHHRGQLSTYLRPMGAKVPDIYGGSFDEPFKG